MSKMPPPDATRVTREQVLAYRLDGHNLARRRPLDDLLDVAGACGIRNTPPGSAPLAFHARVAGLTLDAIERALAVDKTLVEVLAMRISPHLVPAGDAAHFTLGSLPADDESLRGVLVSLSPILDRVGMAPSEALRLAADAARSELEGGPLARGALSAAMTRRLPEGPARPCKACGSTHVDEALFRLVGVRGVFVITRSGKHAAYVRTDRWLGASLDSDRLLARGELLRRYLRCFGPSTAEHFAAWAGLGRADGQRSWDEHSDRLVAVDLDGRAAWLHADDRARLESPLTPGGIRLLPPYDAYLDQRDRATLLPNPALHSRVWKIIGNPGAVLASGEIVGLWRPKKQGKRLTLAVEAFAPLSPSTRADVEAEAASLAPLRGCASAEVTFGE